MVRALILASMLALPACQTTGGSFCDIASAIRPSQEQIDQMTDAQVNELLAHNEKGQRLCGWKP